MSFRLNYSTRWLFLLYITLFHHIHIFPRINTLRTHPSTSEEMSVFPNVTDCPQQNSNGRRRNAWKSHRRPRLSVKEANGTQISAARRVNGQKYFCDAINRQTESRDTARVWENKHILTDRARREMNKYVKTLDVVIISNGDANVLLTLK